MLLSIKHHYLWISLLACGVRAVLTRALQIRHGEHHLLAGEQDYYQADQSRNQNAKDGLARISLPEITTSSSIKT